MVGIPSNVVLANKVPPPVKGLVAPFISTAPDMRDGSRPVNTKPSSPVFIPSVSNNIITATIVDGGGATSFQVRVNAGPVIAGLSTADLVAGETYGFQVRGINAFGIGDWSASVPVTLELVTPSTGADPYFSDSFSTGDLSKTTGGFSWRPVAGDVQVTTANPRTGTHSVALTFGPDQSGAYDEAQLSFALREPGDTSLTAFWLEWYLFVPQNFALRADGANYNNKLLAVYAENYSSASDIQWVGEYGRDTDDEATMRAVCMTGAGCVANGVAPAPVFDASHKGTWVRMRGYFEAGLGNGVTKIWRDDTLVWSVENYDHHAEGGNNFWRKGYFLGTANTGFTEATTFYIDDVLVYDQNPNWQFGSTTAVVPFFTDDFESGDFSRTQTSDDSVARWVATNVAVVNTGGYLSDHAAEFTFGPDAAGTYSQAQLNFDFGKAVSEVWVKARLFIPENYYHRTKTTSNNKLFQLNFDGQPYQALTIETLTRGDGTSDLKRFMSASEDPSDGSTNWTSSDKTTEKFIGPDSTYFMQIGKWNELLIHFRSSTDGTAKDGIAELYANGKLVHALAWEYWNIAHAGQINGGYFLGTANSGFTDETKFLLDDVEIFMENPGENVIFEDAFASGDFSGSIYAGSIPVNCEVSNQNALSGTHAMRFAFAGVPTGSDSHAQRNFDLGEAQASLDVEFDLYIPDGNESYGGAAYTHRSESPSNNKLLRLWSNNGTNSGTNGYNSAEKVGASLVAGTGGASNLILEALNPEIGGGMTALETITNFITASDRGKWMKVRFSIMSASSAGAGDGLLRVFKNGNIEGSVPLNNWAEGEQHAYRYGYLMGAANSGFTDNTYLFIDNLRFISGSLRKFVSMVAEDFSNLTLGETYANGSWKAGQCVIDGTRAFTGNRSLKITLDPGQGDNSCGGDGYYGGRQTLPAVVPPGKTIWYRLRAYFPSEFSWGYVYQNNNAADEAEAANCGHPQFSDGNVDLKFMRLTPDVGSRNYLHLPVHRRNVAQPAGPHAMTLASEPGAITHQLTAPEGRLEMDAWNTLEWAVHVAKDGTGWMRAWRNGKFVGEVTGIDTIGADATGIDEWAIGTHFNGVQFTDGLPGRESFWVDDIIIASDADGYEPPTATDAEGRVCISPAITSEYLK